MTQGWPASLDHDGVGVRPLRTRDGAAWVEARQRNQQWLSPWEGTPEAQPCASWVDRHSSAVYSAMLRQFRREARAGRLLPFGVTYHGRIIGQVTVGTVVRGAFDSATVGYWLDSAVAGRGIMPVALGLVVDHCFGPVGLHRIEANVRPENTASLRVLEKLGFRREGLHQHYLYIDGAWRDHVCYALTREDVLSGGVHGRP